MRYIIFLSLIFCVQFSFANETCGALFNPVALHISNNWSMLRTEEQFVRLIRMSSENGKGKISKKTVIDKGEIDLGVPLQDGNSLVFSYRLDARVSSVGSNPVYKLLKIELMDKMGKKSVLSEDPVNFQKNTFNPLLISDAKLVEAARNLDMPTQIEGPVVEKFVDALPWLGQLNAHEIAKLDRQHSYLYALGRLRSFKEFFKKEVAKQIFRGVFIGSAVFGSQYAVDYIRAVPQISKAIVKQDLVMQRSLMTSIIKSQQISANEKAYFVESLQLASESKPKGKKLKLESKDIAIEVSDQSGMYWIYDLTNNRIFIADISILHVDKKNELGTSTLVEVTAEGSPATYQYVMDLFQKKALGASSDL